MSTRFPVHLAIVAITLLALMLGGAVDLWAQTIVAALAGFLMLVAPPRGPLRRAPLLLGGLFFLLALAAFLPALSPNTTPWQHHLAFDCRIPPLPTRTQQPWLTAQACGLLLVGLVWALYLFHEPWDKTTRVRATIPLAVGVALLAGVAALVFLARVHVPFWRQEQNRGWFPNRNQTADVLAVVGVITYALIFDRLRRRQWIGFVLLTTLVPLAVELVISYSRAGILLFFGGLFVWHVWPRAGKKQADGSIKWVTLSAALALILLAIFLTWGGETLQRFVPPEAHGVGDFGDFRGAIQWDALRFSAQSPFLGVGLGNFEPLFSFSRVASINANRAIHPESDWLWIACEMGWLAPVLILAAVIWWIRRVLPLQPQPGESMRLAFIIATLVFLLHGLVDVSGHRLGSLGVGLLAAALALPPARSRRPDRWTPLLFRLLGLVLLLIATWWACSLRGLRGVPPTTATLARLVAQAEDPANGLGARETAARAALRLAPLDWSNYARLGTIEASQPTRVKQAVADYRTARALNPFYIVLFLNEGKTWLDVNEPDLCLDAWTDGLRRAGPQAPEAFRQLAEMAPPHSIVREGLAELAMDRIDYLLILLPTSSVEEADALLTHLLQVDPTLGRFDETARGKLFAAWWTQGDQTKMIALVGSHPEWDGETWKYRAQHAAKQNDYEKACAILAQWVRPPPVPQTTSDRTLAEQRDDFRRDPKNISTGMILYLAQMRTGAVDDALATLQALEKLHDCPAYVWYLEAQIDAAEKRWQAAYEAWEEFLKP